MKRFLEHYGFGILISIVIIILIAISTPVGNLVKNEIIDVDDLPVLLLHTTRAI